MKRHAYNFFWLSFFFVSCVLLAPLTPAAVFRHQHYRKPRTKKAKKTKKHEPNTSAWTDDFIKRRLQN